MFYTKYQIVIIWYFFRDEISKIENDNEMTAEAKEAALDELLTAIIVKYPSAGVEESLAVRYLTLEEYKNKVDTALENIPEEDEKNIIKDYK